MPAFLRSIDGGACEIRLRVVPGASRSEIVGVLGDRLKVRVTSPAEGGKANRAVIEVLAERLGLPAREVGLVSGQTSRDKTVRIRGRADLIGEKLTADG